VYSALSSQFQQQQQCPYFAYFLFCSWARIFIPSTSSFCLSHFHLFLLYLSIHPHILCSFLCISVISGTLLLFPLSNLMNLSFSRGLFLTRPFCRDVSPIELISPFPVFSSILFLRRKRYSNAAHSCFQFFLFPSSKMMKRWNGNW